MNISQFKQDKYFRKYRVISNVENNLKFHAREEIGDRDKMEDATCCLSGFINTGEIDQSLNGVVYENLSFFGVFDGHAGSRASSYCAENMHKILADKLSKAFSNKTSLEQTEKEIKRYFVETFRQCDDEFLKIAANK